VTNRKWLGVALLTVTLAAPHVGADQTSALEGTWSGDWTPKGGIATAVTVTLTTEANGKLTGSFLSPVRMEIASAAYNPKTHGLTIDALDKSSGATYKLVGKVAGTDITGTIAVGDRTGHVLLIKWTYTGVGFK
jgi:hypothetical protein